MLAIRTLSVWILVKTVTHGASVKKNPASIRSGPPMPQSSIADSVAAPQEPRESSSILPADKGKRPLIITKTLGKSTKDTSRKAKVIELPTHKKFPRDQASGYWRTLPRPTAIFSPGVVIKGDPAGEGTSQSSSYKSARVIGEDRRAERKAAFWAQYHDQKLGHHLPEKMLAEKVRAIEVKGSSSQWKSAWVKIKLKQMGASDQYIANFRQRTKELTYKFKGARKTAGKGVSEEELLERIRLTEEKKNKEGHVRRWSAPQLEQKERQEALTAKAGESFEAHMKAKDLDVDKLSAEEIEYHSRDMKTEGAKNRFAMSLNRYLTKERPSIDLDIFKSHRDDHLKTLSAQRVALQGRKRKRGRNV